MANSFRGAYLVLAACLATLAPGIASAQAVPVTVAPYSLTATGVSGGQLQAAVVYEAKAAQTAANARFYSRAVAFSQTTVANGVRSRIALGPAVALSAAMLGMGWVLDNTLGTITHAQDPNFDPLPGGIIGWCLRGVACNTPYPSANDAMQSWATWGGANWSIWDVQWSPTGSFCNCNGPGYFFQLRDSNGVNGGWSYAYAMYEGGATIHQTDPGAYDDSPPGPVSDAAIANAVYEHPATWPEVLHNPNGSPRVLTPMPSQMQEVQTQYRNDTGTALTSGQTEPTPVPSAQEGTVTNTEPVPAGSSVPPPAASSGGDFELPDFCSWATVVCDAVTWFQDDEFDETELEVPTVEVDASVEYVSGLGPGSCPAPHTMNLLGNSYAMSYEPVCDLAEGGRVFVLVSATLMAGLMLLRVFT